MRLILGSVCAVVDLAFRKRDKYVFCVENGELFYKLYKSITEHTFSIWSLIDLSPDAMSVLIARNAAIRTSSSALDHSFRQVCSIVKFWIRRSDSTSTNLQIRLDRLPTTCDVRYEFRTLVNGKHQRLGSRQLFHKVENVEEI